MTTKKTLMSRTDIQNLLQQHKTFTYVINITISVLLAYDVHSSLHFLSVFVKCVHHHNRRLDFIFLKPLQAKIACLSQKHRLDKHSV